MTTGKKIELARREKDLSQETLAKLIGVNRATIIRYEADNVEKIDAGVLKQIAYVTDKPISYFLSEEEAEARAIELLEGSSTFSVSSRSSGFNSGDKSVKSGIKSLHPIILWTKLYKESTISPLFSYNKGESMASVSVDEDVLEEYLRKGDCLDLNINSPLEDSRYYLFRDIKLKKVIYRIIKRYGDKVILRQIEGVGEEEFDSRRFELIGRVVRQIREL